MIFHSFRQCSKSDSPGLTGVIRLHNCLYAFAPITVRNMEHFLSLLVIPLVVKKCSSHSAYSSLSSRKLFYMTNGSHISTDPRRQLY